MLIRRNRGWELREAAATPEAVFMERRALLKAMGFGALLIPGMTAAIASDAAEWENQLHWLPL